MCLQGDCLANLLGVDKSAEIVLIPEREPSKVDHVQVKEMDALEAMCKVAALVPNTVSMISSKVASTSVQVMFMFHK